MKKREIIVSLECFVKKGNKYLMLKRNQDKKIMPGVWMAPGGKREFNEGLFTCAKREIKEETGIIIKNIRIKACACAYLEDLKQEIFFHLLFADYKSGRLKKSEDGKLQWFKSSEILKLPHLLSELRILGEKLFTENKEIITYKAVYKKDNKLKFFRIEKP